MATTTLLTSTFIYTDEEPEETEEAWNEWVADLETAGYRLAGDEPIRWTEMSMTFEIEPLEVVPA